MVHTRLFFVKLKFFESFHYVVGKLAAGCAAWTTCYYETLFFKGTDVKRTLELVCSVLVSDVRKKHYDSAKHRAGVCILSSAFVYHSGS